LSSEEDRGTTTVNIRTENFVKFGLVVSEKREQTVTQTYALIVVYLANGEEQAFNVYRFEFSEADHKICVARKRAVIKPNDNNY